MSADKTFTVAGVSTSPAGVCKIRVANNIMRVKTLAREQHTDIRFVELSRPMNKVDIARFLLTIPEFQDLKAQDAITDFLDNNSSDILNNNIVESKQLEEAV